MDNRITAKLNSDKGFSIVELIIVVSILAIAAIPLMRSMSLASRTNAKAQSMQNATSLAESVMEEVKATPIDVLKTTYGTDFSGGVMTFKMKDKTTGSNELTATQGEKFIATVTIDTNKYSDDSDLTTKKGKVIAANKMKLPLIEDIDTNTQAVLTSSGEFNRYDKDALNYFNHRIADYPTHKAEITSKTINIVKSSSISAGYDVITVKARVTYGGKIVGGASLSDLYVRDLYTGSFTPELKDGSSTEYKPLDSNIYIFYQKGASIPSSVTESIVIEDTSTYSVSGSPTDSHRIYYVRQKVADVTGPAIYIIRSGKTYLFKYTSTSSEPSITPSPTPATEDKYNITGEDGLDDGNKIVGGSGEIMLITNLSDSVSNAGHIYKQEARVRVYDITVVLTKPGDASGTKYAELNSTIGVGKTPTPTAIPTSPP